jgi:hypothetical protein
MQMLILSCPTEHLRKSDCVIYTTLPLGWGWWLMPNVIANTREVDIRIIVV